MVPPFFTAGAVWVAAAGAVVVAAGAVVGAPADEVVGAPAAGLGASVGFGTEVGAAAGTDGPHAATNAPEAHRLIRNERRLMECIGLLLPLIQVTQYGSTRTF